MMYDYSAPRFSADEIIIYLRKSRADDPSLSVEEILIKHELILDEWAERNLGERIPESNKYREVVSGETIADRPEIKKVLRIIESPKIKALLCVDVQRISRGDLEDAGRLIKLLRYSRTQVITPQKIYDLQNEYDRDIFERELKRGNEYLEYQKKIMSRGVALSVSQGNFLGSIPPYGYNKIFIQEGKRKSPTLEENKQEADVVRMIFDMYAKQNIGINNICHRLDALGVAPPHGKYWSPAAVRDMLQNVHYIGKIRWNRRKTVAIVENGEIKKIRPKAKDYDIYDGKHAPIVSEDVFLAANEKLGKNARMPGGKTMCNPLSGLIYCACGRTMTLRKYTKSDGSERCKPRLMCDDHVHCHTGSCTYDEMVKCINDILTQEISDCEIMLKNDQGDNIKIHENLIRNLEQRLRNLEEKELAQWEAQYDPVTKMPPEIFRKLNEKLLLEKSEVEEALNTARSTLPRSVIYKKKLAKLREALSALHDTESSPSERNVLLKNCIDRITYTRDAPQRYKRSADEEKGSVGGRWISSDIILEITLKV